MYAIIETGGKQYKVQEGDIVKVEKLGISAGENVVFDKVIAVSKEGQLTIGAPVISGVTVSASVIEEGKGKKIIVFKYKPKKSSQTKKGHRQAFTKIKIEKINA